MSVLLLNKDFKTIQDKAEEYFKEVGISTTQGSISNLFSSVINSEISEFYETLTTSQKQAFVSSATGEYLDAIGKLVNCERESKETDDNYRYRITQQIPNTASANLKSVQNAALKVKGVDSVIPIPFSKGSGSFDLYIVNNDGSISETILENVRNEVEKVAGYGINYNISEPKYKKINFKLKILFKNTVLYIDKDEIIEKLRQYIFVYINSLGIGEPFNLNKFTSVIMNSNENIANFICEEFKIDNKKCTFTNQYIKRNEKFIINSSYNSIIIN